MTRLRIARASRLAALLLPGLAVAAGLNDTGVIKCANLTQNGQPCSQTDFPRQDAETGRDAQSGLGKAGAGPAGFDFTKLDSDGKPLDASAPAWDCVRDNVTGRVWEIKTDDNGLRDKGWTYIWYNPDPATNGGDAGSTGGATCGGFLGNQCNTQAYTAAVNALNPKLCGFSDWRMPTRDRLRALRPRAKPAARPGFTHVFRLPLKALAGLRRQLRRQGIAHRFIAEEGYLRGGLKRRVLRLIWRPAASRITHPDPPIRNLKPRPDPLVRASSPSTTLESPDEDHDPLPSGPPGSASVTDLARYRPVGGYQPQL
ncbi:MAG: DUF1566 domain-containing protein [Candidatus Contendobacter sp.]|nr:DUF1566 domain-containing protein [Candidatus Contendobacter sp.]